VVLRILLGAGFALCVSSLGALVGYIGQKEGLPLDALQSTLKATVAPGLKHEWRLLRDKHWQIISHPTESQEATDAAEGTRGACSVGMVEAKGLMKLDPSSNSFYDHDSIEELQKTTCTKWINKEYPERCAVFDRPRWLDLSKELPTKPMSFCIDRFEYPDQKGEYPWISVSWYEAQNLCAEDGKRLCDEAEWTFACEGEEAIPYPYGYERDATACVVDQTWKPFNEAAMRPRDGQSAMGEVDRLWQGVPSGSQPRCRSPFGVYDTTGNVDEWTRSVREGERPSILKGGYWGPVRTRCRPSTRSHDENHIFYQQGFRCCSDVGAKVSHRTPTADPATAPFPPAAR
jgi:formylglycine-generating enzyme